MPSMPLVALRRYVYAMLDALPPCRYFRYDDTPRRDTSGAASYHDDTR